MYLNIYWTFGIVLSPPDYYILKLLQKDILLFMYNKMYEIFDTFYLISTKNSNVFSEK